MSDESSNKWAMPKPVFRSSTGELVKPSVEMPVDPEPDTLEPAGPAAEDDPLAKLYAPPEGHKPNPADSEPAKPAAPAVLVEEQPDITDEPAEISAPAVPSLPAQQKGGSVMILLGALFLIAASAGFVYLVYYLFFASRPDSGGF